MILDIPVFCLATQVAGGPALLTNWSSDSGVLKRQSLYSSLNCDHSPPRWWPGCSFGSFQFQGLI